MACVVFLESNLTSALSGMETSALITPDTLESADRTLLTHPTPHVIPDIFRDTEVSETAGAFFSLAAVDLSAA